MKNYKKLLDCLNKVDTIIKKEDIKEFCTCGRYLYHFIYNFHEKDYTYKSNGAEIYSDEYDYQVFLFGAEITRMYLDAEDNWYKYHPDSLERVKRLEFTFPVKSCVFIDLEELNKLYGVTIAKTFVSKAKKEAGKDNVVVLKRHLTKEELEEWNRYYKNNIDIDQSGCR